VFPSRSSAVTCVRILDEKSLERASRKAVTILVFISAASGGTESSQLFLLETYGVSSTIADHRNLRETSS
jgi:hypothetical protein